MWTFDTRLQYQFVVFLGDGEEDLDESVLTELPRQICAPVDNADDLRLKLRDPLQTHTQVFAMPGMPGVSATGFQWPSAAGLWRLDWKPNRLDLHFDALAYFELYDKQITMPATTHRVTPNLARIGDVLHAPITRVSLAVAGESRRQTLPAIEFVARRFFNEDIIELAHREPTHLTDLMARTNRKVVWDLEHAVNGENKGVLINRIETATAAAGAHVPAPYHQQLAWALDINTDPNSLEGSLSATSIQQFFEQAAAWVMSVWPEDRT